MKPALQALLIAPGPMVAKVLDGTKAISIREGHRDYKEGQPILIGCHIANWAVMAQVTSVKHCRLKEVTSEELAADGFASLEDALETLRRFYPDITALSYVTVLRWAGVKGALCGGA